MEEKLGRLEWVDSREVWINEAGDFTPWLAEEDNLALLGEAIGIELDLDAREKDVGPFRADLLCKDTATDNWVLVENQLERTDHTHLGQLLTYAAGLNAVTIVWVAAKFADDHRAAIDWLNEVTASQINFFGLEIELWRIGESPIAPKFNVVSKPNDWAKIVTPPPEGLTETQRLQQDYWAALREHLLKRESSVKPQKPLPQQWTNFAVGRSHFHLAAFVNTREKRIAVGLVLSGPDAKPHFYLLKEDREAIEEEIGASLEWRELLEGKESRIMLQRPQTDPTDREDWPQQHHWLAQTLEAFDRAFRPRVKELDARDYQLEVEPE